jgi:hypothetical protein
MVPSASLAHGVCDAIVKEAITIFEWIPARRGCAAVASINMQFKFICKKQNQAKMDG